VKGKYAAKAVRRREFTGFEERAVTAERERDRLASELAELRKSSERQIAILRDRAAEVRRQQDAVADPRMAELEAANRRLRTRLNAAVLAEKQMSHGYLKSIGQVVQLLRGPRFELSKEEVDDLLFGEESPRSQRLTAAPMPTQPKDAILRALPHPQGDDLRIVAYYEESRAVKRRADRERDASLDAHAEEFATPIYAYDAAQSSFTIERDLDFGNAAVRVSIECPQPDVTDGGLLATMMLPAAELAKLAVAIRRDPVTTEEGAER
jgi:multidrug efflux pump subunit AcrA (membrane-fusion protein)